MLTSEGMEKGRAWVGTPDEYLERVKPHVRQRNERNMQGGRFAIIIGGLCENGDLAFPYPGHYGTTAPVTALRRDQAEHLTVELLKKLAPGGELPTDAAELLDFVSSLIRSGSAPA